MFASDRNFRSTISATKTLGARASPINWPSISTPIFNSSSQLHRPVMGIISPPSISGFRPPIVNPLFQFGSSIFCSSPAKLDAFPAGSSKSTTGSSSYAPSPAQGGAPVVPSTTPASQLSNSSTRPSQLSSVNPPVNSAVLSLIKVHLRFLLLLFRSKTFLLLRHPVLGKKVLKKCSIRWKNYLRRLC